MVFKCKDETKAKLCTNDFNGNCKHLLTDENKTEIHNSHK